jgi:hypothetical protein
MIEALEHMVAQAEARKAERGVRCGNAGASDDGDR